MNPAPVKKDWIEHAIGQLPRPLQHVLLWLLIGLWAGGLGWAFAGRSAALKMLIGFYALIFGSVTLYWISVFWVVLWTGLYIALSRLPLLACILALIGLGTLGFQNFAIALLVLIISVLLCAGITFVGNWIRWET